MTVTEENKSGVLPATGADLVATAVTALFVPGDRPERFAKAAAAGADIVIIDLEDAVAPSEKQGALSMVLARLNPVATTESTIRALVRVNSLGTATGANEIAGLLEVSSFHGNGLLGLVIPKAEDPDEIAALARRLPEGLALIPLVESARGIVNALELAEVPGVTRLAFGAIDFALDIDADGGDRFLDYARSRVVVASRAAGIAAPLDSPSLEIKEATRIAEASLLARNFGFGGKLCIHPAQITSVREAFFPSEENIEWAHSVIAAEVGGSAQIDGQMIDLPVIERAKRIVSRAGRRN